MKNKYIRGLLLFAAVSTLAFTGCTGTAGNAGGDAAKQESKSETIEKKEKSSSDSSSEEKKEDKNEDGDKAKEKEDRSSDVVEEEKKEATEKAVVEDGWISSTLYDLSYATPSYFNMVIDDISDHSERGPYYERAYDIGEGDSSSIGIHFYAYEKHAGIVEETSYTDAKSRTEDYKDLEFETVDIPNLAATVYRASEMNANSYLPYTYVYIFEKSEDDPYIYEIYFNDRFEESAIRLAFEKSLAF